MRQHKKRAAILSHLQRERMSRIVLLQFVSIPRNSGILKVFNRGAVFCGLMFSTTLWIQLYSCLTRFSNFLAISSALISANFIGAPIVTFTEPFGTRLSRNHGFASRA